RSRYVEGARFAAEAQDVDSRPERDRGQLRGDTARVGRSPPGDAVRRGGNRRGPHVPHLVTKRTSDDPGAHGRGGTAEDCRPIPVGAEHHARRRVRALHGPRAARRAAGGGSGRSAGVPRSTQLGTLMGRMWAIIERELRRFRRSPVLIVVSMVFPIVQLVVLGYAFGGNVKHLKLAIVDQDHSVPAVKLRELAGAVAGGARTFDTVDYAD